MVNNVQQRVGFKTINYRIVSVTKETDISRPTNHIDAIKMKSNSKYWLVYVDEDGIFISKEINNDGSTFINSKDIIKDGTTWVMTIDDYGVLETNLKGVI